MLGWVFPNSENRLPHRERANEAKEMHFSTLTTLITQITPTTPTTPTNPLTKLFKNYTGNYFFRVKSNRNPPFGRLVTTIAPP